MGCNTFLGQGPRPARLDALSLSSLYLTQGRFSKLREPGEREPVPPSGCRSMANGYHAPPAISFLSSGIADQPEPCPKQAKVAALIVALFCLMGLLSPRLSADVIVMKGESGEKIEGVIDEERSDEKRVFIRTRVGLLPIARNRIERIERRDNVEPEEREGDLAFQRGDYEQALELFLEASEKTGQDETLDRKIAETHDRIDREKQRRYADDFHQIEEYVRRREFNKAVEHALRLVEEAPDESSEAYVREKLASTYLDQARAYKNLVNYTEAEKIYRKAIEASPQSAIAQLELAELISEAPSRREEAFALYREGLTYAGEDPTLVEEDQLLEHRYQEAQLYYRESLYREAAELFWAVLQAGGADTHGDVDEKIVRALSFIQEDLWEETDENDRALVILEGIIEMEPSRADAQYLLGRIYCEREQWDKVIPAMEKALRGLVGPNASSDRAEARKCLAKAYRSAGENQQAAVQLESLVAAQPARYNARCDLGEIYLIQLDYEEALNQFNQAIRLDEDIYRGYLGAARALRNLNRYQEARENYEKLLDLRDDHPAYLYELGLTYADLGNHTTARDYFRRAVDLIKGEEPSSEQKAGEAPPLSDEYREILSKVYTQLGLASVAERNYYEAIQNFDRALDSEPDLAAAYDGKGQAYRELGKLEEAEDYFKQALARDPDNPKFLLNLGVFFHKLKKNREKALPYYMKYFEAGGTDPQVRDWIRECGGTPPRIS